MRSGAARFECGDTVHVTPDAKVQRWGERAEREAIALDRKGVTRRLKV